MTDKTTAALYDACDSVNSAAVPRATGQPIVPDYYSPIGALVSVTRAIRHLLYTFPHLTEFDPGEYYDSQGQEPGTYLEAAETALDDAINDLHNLDGHLNKAWEHIGRIGLRTDITAPTS